LDFPGIRVGFESPQPAMLKVKKRKEVEKMLFAPKEKGQGLVEYALIIVLVAIVVIVILVILGPAISNVFSNIIHNL
jgi:pilus assembly protein Flp/PilA